MATCGRWCVQSSYSQGSFCQLFTYRLQGDLIPLNECFQKRDSTPSNQYLLKHLLLGLILFHISERSIRIVGSASHITPTHEVFREPEIQTEESQQSLDAFHKIVRFDWGKAIEQMESQRSLTSAKYLGSFKSRTDVNLACMLCHPMYRIVQMRKIITTRTKSYSTQSMISRRGSIHLKQDLLCLWRSSEVQVKGLVS